MRHSDFVVIGGGLSGTALAWQLARRRAGSVLLLERESALGTHASAQNAAMIRRLVEDEAIASLARRGAALLDRPPADLVAALAERLGTAPLVRRCGSILVASSRGGRAQLERMCDHAKRAGVAAEMLEPSAVAERLPAIAASRISGGVLCAADGITDPDALVQAYAAAAEGAGARILTGVRALGASRVADRLVAVKTSRGEIACAAAIDAGGAWAAEIASEMGSPPPPLRPHRRHIAVTAPIPGSADWPILWDVEGGLYVRPEAGRVMISACDQDAWHACVPPADAAFLTPLAEKALELFPGTELPIARWWAGLRTFPPDGRFVLGPDPHLEGLHWAAGLGGHGVTVAAASAELVAQAVLGEAAAELEPHRAERWVSVGS